MRLKFFTWLRETGRLYLRYMAVGLCGTLFATLYALGKNAGWDERVILPVALACAFATALFVWKWMGDWQERPIVQIRPFDATWQR
jgi:hypothetical protein